MKFDSIKINLIDEDECCYFQPFDQMVYIGKDFKNELFSLNDNDFLKVDSQIKYCQRAKAVIES